MRDSKIESCCGGGGRIDLGIMEHCDRVWVSDCIDAHERQRLQRWSSVILPPELLGTHVGADRDHITNRTLDLDFRAATAIWGHFGIEWDLTATDPEHLARLRQWVDPHKQLRPLLHAGTVVHADATNPALQLDGVVARDRNDTLYRLSAIAHSVEWPLGRITLPGLDADRTYLVSIAEPSGAAPARRPQPRWTAQTVVVTGDALERVGLSTPVTAVDQAVLIRAVAVDAA
ncbi:MAG: alpha-galactosidase [Microbacterium sp.]